MTFNLSRRPNVKIGIEMSDFCQSAQRLRMPVAKIRGVDEIESAGSGFLLDSKRPKILFEGHLFYRHLKKKGLAVKAQAMEPSICYPTWTKRYYIGRDGEYARLAKATEICHALGISDAFALWSASWGRYQILGSNFLACGYENVEAMVEAMFLDEDNHLEAFAEYIVSEGIDDELRSGNIIGFVSRYNGPGYARNNYHIKLPAAIRRFEKQNINCREVLEGQVIAVMPGIRDTSPGATGFANTGLDDRYLNDDDDLLGVLGPVSAAVPAVANLTVDKPSIVDEPQISTPQNEQPSGQTQIADQIINTGDTPPPAPATKDIEMTAPVKDGATATATKQTILGLTVPPSLYLIYQSVLDMVEKGYIDAREIGSGLFRMLTDNWSYVFILIGLIIVLQIVKKVIKAVVFLVMMITAAVPSWNTITVVPPPVEEKGKWWQFWK